MSSILSPLFQWAEHSPDKLLYAFLDVDGRKTASYSYAQFIQRTTDIASHMQRVHPMKPGERVLLAYPPGLEMICAFFACVRLGLVPVPVYPPTSQGFDASLNKMNHIATDCSPAAVLTERAYFYSMKLNQTRNRVARLSFRKDAVSRLKWIVSTNAEAGVAKDFTEAHTDLLFLQYTSGSTSDPKGVMVTHQNILDNGEAVVDHLPVGVSWLPQYHDMGLIGYYIFFALKGGTTYGFSPMDFIRRPALWLETISKYRGTASSAPNFAYAYCLRPGKLPEETFDGLDLSSLRFLMTAAEPVRAQVYRDFLNRFQPYGLNPRSFFSAYGLAEYTLAVCNYGRTIGRFERESLTQHLAEPAAPTTLDIDTTSLVSCGRPMGTAEVKIVDASATPRELDPGRVGEIWVRGGSKCQGYWNRPELSAEVFEAVLPTDDPADSTWLRTGDLGFLHHDELFISGRTKDLIIHRGMNYYPQDIEILVESDPGIRKGCVAAFGHEEDGREKVIVVAEVRDPMRLPETRPINQRVVELLGIVVDTWVFVQARTIPKTSSGKIVRHRTRQHFVEGRLETILQIDSDLTSDAGDMLRQRQYATQVVLRDLGGFGGVFEKYGLLGSESCTLGDAGLDSIMLVEFSQDLQVELQRQGHADLAESVVLPVLQNISVSELVALLGELAAAAPRAKERFRKVLSDMGQEHRRSEQAMMRRDARLRFDPGHLPILASPGPAPSAVLLTGGTGFFGPFLLASLLGQTNDTIYVLVRAESDEEGLERLVAGLDSLSLEGGTPRAWLSRIHPVCGDLSLVNLGLSTTRWNEIAEKTRAIYHNGALVHYLHDYTTMRDVNVGGTNEVIRLAMSHRPKVLNHISTTFIFGWSVEETLSETDNNAHMDLLDFGYSQSKWVAEQVVHDAMRQGLHARIFRPALITPSVSGGGDNLDISIRLLAFMLNHQIGTTAQNQVSFSPADLAADNIVAIAQDADSIDGTYHVTRDCYASMSEITSILSELTGRPFTQFSLEDFVPEVIERCRPGDTLFPLLEFLVRSIDNITAMEFKRYDNSQFQQARDRSSQARADPPLRDVVLGILRFMRRRGIVDVEACDPTGAERGRERAC